jgi:PhnB protein
MANDLSYVQPGLQVVTPYVYGKVELVDFVKEVFEAEVIHPPELEADGNFHSELKIGDSPLMIGRGFFTDESMAAANWIYVKDADATYRRALVAGATSVREPSDYPWGDRVAGVKDSSGNTWWIATHKS